MISEIMQYLDSNIDDIDYDATGTTGNIFDNVLPTSPDTAVMVENTGGFPRDMRNTEYFEPSIRILVRGDQDPRTARDLANDIIDEMGTLASMEFVDSDAEWRVVKCQAIQAMPINIGRDDNDRHRFSCNFELEVQRKE
ncbi:MAG: minor capsid protein [Bacillota bacterium]